MILVPYSMRSGKRCVICGTGQNVSWVDDDGHPVCNACRISKYENLTQTIARATGTTEQAAKDIVEQARNRL